MQYIMSLGIPWGGSPLRGFEGEFLFVHPGSHAADPPAAVKVQRRVRVVQVDLPLVFVAAEMEINRGVGVCRLRYRWNKSTCHLSFAMRPGRVDSCFLYCLLLQILYLLPKSFRPFLISGQYAARVPFSVRCLFFTLAAICQSGSLRGF